MDVETLKALGNLTGTAGTLAVLIWVVKTIREGQDATAKALIALRIAFAKRGIAPEEDGQ